MSIIHQMDLSINGSEINRMTEETFKHTNVKLKRNNAKLIIVFSAKYNGQSTVPKAKVLRSMQVMLYFASSGFVLFFINYPIWQPTMGKIFDQSVLDYNTDESPSLYSCNSIFDVSKTVIEIWFNSSLRSSLQSLHKWRYQWTQNS